MTLSQIAVASTLTLRRRLDAIVPLVGTEEEGDYPAEVEYILEELQLREHDRRDPSSGLGLHQET